MRTSSRYSTINSLRSARRAHSDTVIPHLLFLVLTALVVYWFHDQTPIGWSDTGLLAFLYNPSTIMHNIATAWNGLVQLGNPSAQYIGLLPTSLLFAGGHAIGISYVVLEATLYGSITYTTLYFSYRMFLVCCDSGTTLSIPALLGATAFTFSPMVGENYWMFGNSSIFVPPLIAGTIYLGLKASTSAWSYWRPLQFLALLIYCAPTLGNPGYALPPLLMGLLFFLVASHSLLSIWDRIFRLFAFVSTALIGLAWLIVPLVSEASTLFTSASIEESSSQVLVAASANTSLSSLVRLVPLKTTAPAFASYWAPSWRFFYGSAFALLLVALILLIAAYGIIRSWRSCYTRVALILYAVGLALCLGIGSPLSGAVNFVYTFVPGFSVFRNPLNKFLPFLVVGFYLLMTAGLKAALDGMREKYPVALHRLSPRIRRRLFCLLFFATVLAYGYPMTTGQIVREVVRVNGSVLSPGVTVPRQVATIKSTLDRLHVTRVLVLPLSTNGYRWESWQNGYSGPDLSSLLFDTGSLSQTIGQVGIASGFIDEMAGLSAVQQIDAGAFAGAQAAIVAKDTVYFGQPLGMRPGPVVSADLAALHTLGSKLVLNGSRYAVYLLSNPRSSLTYTALNSSEIGFNVTSAILSGLGSLAVPLGQVHGGVLSYDTAYNSSWTASLRVVGGNRSCRAVGTIESKHIVVNGFSNGWLIPSIVNGCDVVVRIRNESQYLFVRSEVFTLIALAVILIVAAVRVWLRGRRECSNRGLV